MKFERTPQFDADLRRLSEYEYQRFRQVARDEFSPACDRYAADPAAPWPARLQGELRIRWRRVGGHAIFSRP